MDGKRRSTAPVPHPEVAERNSEMLRRYQAGESLARIGSSLGLTRERVRQIVRDAGGIMPLTYICAV